MPASAAIWPGPSPAFVHASAVVWGAARSPFPGSGVATAVALNSRARITRSSPESRPGPEPFDIVFSRALTEASPTSFTYESPGVVTYDHDSGRVAGTRGLS